MSKQDKNILFTNTPLEVEASYCEVIIPLALPTNYTWSIPEHLQHAAKVGIRVEVQLRNKKYAGIFADSESIGGSAVSFNRNRRYSNR